MYYHPALLEADEQALRNVFNEQNKAHDQLNVVTGLGMFAAFWPVTYSLSKTVRPTGCAFFAAAYMASYFKIVKPLTLSRF